MRAATVAALCAGILAGCAVSWLPADAGFYSGPPAPAPCSMSPSGDTLLGSPGSMPCFVPQDATRPTAVQAVNVMTGTSDGAWSVTWARPFVATAPIVLPIPVNTGSLPLVCNVVSRSATGATGKCWQSTSTTLTGTLVGLIVNPFGAAAGNAAVMVIGREPTQ